MSFVRMPRTGRPVYSRRSHLTAVAYRLLATAIRCGLFVRRIENRPGVSAEVWESVLSRMPVAGFTGRERFWEGILVRRVLALIVAFVFVLTAFVGGAAASKGDATEELQANASQAEAFLSDNTFGIWFVELRKPPLADVDATFTKAEKRAYLHELEAEKNAFRIAARESGVAFKERFSYGILWNGLSIEVDPTQLSEIGSISSVRSLAPVMTASIPGFQSLGADPDLATALAMTGADVAQSTLGFTGAGIRVAVMDTGVDYDHPDLGGCFGPGCRVETGFDFVGDAFNADPTSPFFNPVPVPDPDPDDCNGHGTHVAGIVGAHGAVTGVAPDVTIGAYRVFGCDGSTTADIMLAAMEAALEDDMDILNMSIGSAFQWPQYPTALASDRLVREGMVVVASIGNSAANGVYSAGAPGLGEKVIGVAAFDNTHVRLPTFTVAPAGITAGYTNAVAAPTAPTSGSLPLAKSGTPTSTADACNVGTPPGTPFTAGQFAGKAVLVRRGTCTFHQKALNAQTAGASAVVLYNNAPGRVSPTVAGTPAITIPVVAITAADGAAISNALDAEPQTLTWQSTLGTFTNPTGGLISSFSSYGLSPDLSLKPDIGAPGGLIRSTFPLELGGYATISGTSMSSPHVAGAAALLLQSWQDGDGEHGDTDDGTLGEEVRDVLQNSADPRPWWGNPGLGFLDNVHRQGAGMLDIDDAILSTVRITPGKLALGESEAGPATRRLTICNTGPSDVTLALSHAPALSTAGSTFNPAFSTGFASVAFSRSGVSITQVTGKAGCEIGDDESGTTLLVTITANPALPDRSQYGGYLVFTPLGGGALLRVPYAGFKGDYQSIVAITPTGAGFPWLAKLVGPNFVKQIAGATFTCTGLDFPFILVHLDHQVRYLRAEVFEVGTGKSFQRAFSIDFVPRNSAATSFFAIDWENCLTTKGRKVITVPDGQYVITMTALKALGDPTNPAHIETWTSPAFNIDRP